MSYKSYFKTLLKKWFLVTKSSGKHSYTYSLWMFFCPFFYIVSGALGVSLRDLMDSIKYTNNSFDMQIYRNCCILRIIFRLFSTTFLIILLFSSLPLFSLSLFYFPIANSVFLTLRPPTTVDFYTSPTYFKLNTLELIFFGSAFNTYSNVADF